MGRGRVRLDSARLSRVRLGHGLGRISLRRGVGLRVGGHGHRHWLCAWLRAVPVDSGRYGATHARRVGSVLRRLGAPSLEELLSLPEHVVAGYEEGDPADYDQWFGELREGISGVCVKGDVHGVLIYILA